ncbi:MAG TPA: hypothetical protein VK878_23290 [Candidatus Deferrimicrobiaceae bacterium]|nr:hypothetical protein [Candidatus Deferrimicrobiaceae bacterium]
MDEQAELNNLARIGYEAYAAHQEWKAFNGSSIPVWGMVRPDIRSAWESAVLAITEAS